MPILDREPSEGEHRAWRVSQERPEPGVSLFTVELGDYREYFLVAAGRKTLAITMFDPSDAAYPEPQTFTFAKPYGWDTGLEPEEALLQVWQAVGVLR